MPATLTRTTPEVTILDMRAGEQIAAVIGDTGYWCRDVAGGWEISPEFTDRVYFVAVHHNHAQSCTCPDYVYRRQKVGGRCKHFELAEKLQRKCW